MGLLLEQGCETNMAMDIDTGIDMHMATLHAGMPCLHADMPWLHADIPLFQADTEMQQYRHNMAMQDNGLELSWSMAPREYQALVCLSDA